MSILLLITARFASLDLIDVDVPKPVFYMLRRFISFTYIDLQVAAAIKLFNPSTHTLSFDQMAKTDDDNQMMWCDDDIICETNIPMELEL